MTHSPQTINKFETGLVQNQPNQILVNDAFPVLYNALVFRNTVRRRLSWKLVGRLTRSYADESIGNSGASVWSFNIYTLLGISGEANAAIDIGTVIIKIGAIEFTDQGDGTLTSPTIGNSGTINYATGDIALTHTAGAGIASTATLSYFPALPAMGVFDRNNASNAFENIFMDTKYTYRFVPSSGFSQFPTGATWTLNDFNLPSPQNYWQDLNNLPIFWITNIKGPTGDPIRYTNAQTTWYDFTPGIDGTAVAPNPPNATNFLFQAKFLIPFRGRLFAFNTLEGPTIGTSINYTNRIRCSANTTPFDSASAIITQFNQTAWSDVVPGQGYQQDLPTTEPIIGAWSVMNQIVIKTSTKTWVLTHTGISVAPFKVDLLDDNEGSTSGFSASNMGSYITDVGSRTINNSSPVSVQSIDQKILNFVFSINRDNSGLSRVYSIRDFINRISSFIYPFQPMGANPVKFPNRRLIYNYDNKSWAIYQDSLTCLGYFRENLSITWAEADFTWAEADFTWSQNSNNEPLTCAGNQQGFIGILDSAVEEGASLFLTNVTRPSATEAATFTSPDSNLEDDDVVEISGIVGDFSSLNGSVGQVQTIDSNNFYLFSYDPNTGRFSTPVVIPNAGTYIGGGLLTVRRNFNIVTKAFNFIEEGQSMHISYVDTLVNTNPGVDVQLGVYASLDNSNAVNLIPENITDFSLFGNKVSLSNPTTYPLNEVNNRSLVNQRANMLTLEFSLSDETLASDNFGTPFVLSSMTLWTRRAGRPLMPFGGG